MSATWYNAERVKQPGSTVLAAALPALRETNAARRAQQAPQAALERGDGPITQKDLAQALGAMLGPGGQSVSEKTAMSISAVYACVALLAGAIATLPINIYRRSGDARERVRNDIWWLLNEQPRDEISAAVAWEYAAASYFLHGDMFVQIMRPNFRSSGVAGLLPIDPRKVRVDQLYTGELVYEIADFDVLGPRRVLQADMIHVPALGFDGKRGMSPVRYAGTRAMRIALAAEEFSEAFFTNGARPDFVIKTPGKLTTEQADVLLHTWNQRYMGTANRMKPAVLTGGLDIAELAMSNEDASLIATRQFQVEDICRIYGVPPFMVGHTDKTTSWGAGVENMGRGFLKFTLQRHLVKIEQELNRKLWPVRDTYFCEFNVTGLERGDTKTRNDSYRVALGRAGEPGWMTINEVRRSENLPPIDGGDTLNMGAQTNAQEPNPPAAGG
jgi:HK97 family phage portal protein